MRKTHRQSFRNGEGEKDEGGPARAPKQKIHSPQKKNEGSAVTQDGVGSEGVGALKTDGSSALC